MLKNQRFQLNVSSTHLHSTKLDQMGYLSSALSTFDNIVWPEIREPQIEFSSQTSKEHHFVNVQVWLSGKEEKIIIIFLATVP